MGIEVTSTRANKNRNRNYVIIILALTFPLLVLLFMRWVKPIEQIGILPENGYKSDATELLNACERYYSSFGVYPWDIDESSKKPPQIGKTGQNVVNVNQQTESWVYELIESNELKREFADRDGLSKLIIWFDEESNEARICFKPEHKTYEVAPRFSIYGEFVTAKSKQAELVCISESTGY